MKLWIDDMNSSPPGYFCCRSVDNAKEIINKYSNHIDYDNNLVDEIELIDVLDDTGGYTGIGGELLTILDWLKETGKNYPIRIHSVGGWTNEDFIL